MMRQYIWQDADWPNLSWDAAKLLAPIGSARLAQGEVVRAAEFLTPGERKAIELQAIEDAAIDTSAIEGESLDRQAVRSSVMRRLGIDDPIATTGPHDPRADAIVAITVDARMAAAEPLTQERLFAWHRRLFGDGPSRIRVGAWRDDSTGPMQVVSGPFGRERVHFEAPPAGAVPNEMERFLQWFNAPNGADEDGIVRSAHAHLWFVTIHPFEDGNGRIGRAIGDLALNRDNGRVAEYVSMSRQIHREQRDYYAELERAQTGTGDVTHFIQWYVACYERAVRHTLASFDSVLATTRFWLMHRDVAISDRERAVLSRYLEGFDGNFNAAKYAKLAKVSLDTAQRDIADLVEKNVLTKAPGAARNTNYVLRGA